jgi:hypothetical protein
MRGTRNTPGERNEVNGMSQSRHARGAPTNESHWLLWTPSPQWSCRDRLNDRLRLAHSNSCLPTRACGIVSVGVENREEG